ncbi:hypothetical protein H5T53_04015 [Candidatus Bipolaricaulota bacterium]|nr:hypothetical protein [Candidatus Bipolaricaulota bacterium]
MAAGKKAVVVALAAMVAAFPTFAQLSVVQAVPVPAGEELDDVELAKVEGEAAPLVAWLAPYIVKGATWAIKAAKLAAGAGTVAMTTMQKGCQKAVEVGTSLTLKGVSLVQQGVSLAQQGVSLAQQHPLATRTVGSGIASATSTALSGGSLQDVLVAGAAGMLGGATGHAVGKLPLAQQHPLPINVTTGFVTGAGFDAMYKAIDPHQPVTLRGVAVAGASAGLGSLGIEALLLRPKP